MDACADEKANEVLGFTNLGWAGLGWAELGWDCGWHGPCSAMSGHSAGE